METNIVYFDETGDDGLIKTSSDTFILTSIYLSTNDWQVNFNKIRDLRKRLKEEYGFHIKEEMHTKHFLSDKDPYRKYQWSKEEKRHILIEFTKTISEMNLKCINVVIDKTKVIKKEEYDVLKNALIYNIQRIENDITGKSNYLIITDKGRLAPMRKTAREIRAFNPIQSKFSSEVRNQPIKGLIEDLLEKDSSESYFIQICDFVSYFVHLYYKCVIGKAELPNRVGNLIDKEFVGSVLATLKEGNVLNLKASKNRYGLVVYPK